MSPVFLLPHPLGNVLGTYSLTRVRDFSSQNILVGCLWTIFSGASVLAGESDSSAFTPPVEVALFLQFQVVLLLGSFHTCETAYMNSASTGRKGLVLSTTNKGLPFSKITHSAERLISEFLNAFFGPILVCCLRLGHHTPICPLCSSPLEVGKTHALQSWL